jgi:hypothetical protein
VKKFGQKEVRNIRPAVCSPELPLEPVQILEKLLADPNRDYMTKICHMQAWQFFQLAESLKSLIEAPRSRRKENSITTKKGPPQLQI